MKKLILDPDALEIESFDTLAGERWQRGTVAARVHTNPYETCTVKTGCYTDDGCCGANTVGGACDTSGECDDISACWGTLC